MKRKMGTLILVTAIACASLTGCGSKTKDKETTEQTTITDDNKNPDDDYVGEDGAYSYLDAVGSVTKEQRELFEKAIAELDGASLEPLAVIGKQVVAGTNYAYLCKSTPMTQNAEASLTVIIVYEDTNGSVSIVNNQDFDINTIMSQADSDSASSVGGWETVDVADACELNANVLAAFNKSIEGYTGAGFEVSAYLGNQLVAGNNYLFVCKTTTVTPDAVPYMTLVKVYEDFEGNCTIEGVYNIDVAAFNQ